MSFNSFPFVKKSNFHLNNTMIAVVNILFGNRPGDGFEIIYNSLVLPTKQNKIFFHSV